jgi:hypothetical protein
VFVFCDCFGKGIFFQLALDDEGSASYIIGCFLYFGVFCDWFGKGMFF